MLKCFVCKSHDNYSLCKECFYQYFNNTVSLRKKSLNIIEKISTQINKSIMNIQNEDQNKMIRANKLKLIKEVYISNIKQKLSNKLNLIKNLKELLEKKIYNTKILIINSKNYLLKKNINNTEFSFNDNLSNDFGCIINEFKYINVMLEKNREYLYNKYNKLKANYIEEQHKRINIKYNIINYIAKFVYKFTLIDPNFDPYKYFELVDFVNIMDNNSSSIKKHNSLTNNTITDNNLLEKNSSQNKNEFVLVYDTLKEKNNLLDYNNPAVDDNDNLDLKNFNTITKFKNLNNKYSDVNKNNTRFDTININAKSNAFTKQYYNQELYVYIYKLMFIIKKLSFIFKICIPFPMNESLFLIKGSDNIYSLNPNNKIFNNNNISIGLFLLNENINYIRKYIFIDSNTSSQNNKGFMFKNFLNVNCLIIKNYNSLSNEKCIEVKKIHNDITYIEYDNIKIYEDYIDDKDLYYN